jgi:MFS family permease
MRLPTGITRNVFVLGVVSFFTDLSSEMLYPVVPIFLTSALGASPAIVGVIEGLAESTASLMRIWSGWFSDRLGVRKPLVFAGYGLSALARPILAAAYAWPAVLLARILDRLGKGIRGAPRDALIADSCDPPYRGRAFGFHRSMDQLGAVFGPLLGLALLAFFDGSLRTIFLVAFIPSAVSTAMVLVAQEHRGPCTREPVRLSLSWAGSRYKKFLAIVAIFSIGNSADAFLILRARDLGATTESAIALFAVFNAVYVLSAWPAGVVSDRIARPNLYAIGLAVFALVYLGFGLADSAAWLWVLFPVYGLFHGLTDGVSRALVVDLVPADRRATALGLHAAVIGLAAFPASALAGLLWTTINSRAPFLFGAVTAAVAAALLTKTLRAPDVSTGSPS